MPLGTYSAEHSVPARVSPVLQIHATPFEGLASLEAPLEHAIDIGSLSTHVDLTGIRAAICAQKESSKAPVIAKGCAEATRDGVGSPNISASKRIKLEHGDENLSARGKADVIFETKCSFRIEFPSSSELLPEGSLGRVGLVPSPHPFDGGASLVSNQSIALTVATEPDGTPLPMLELPVLATEKDFLPLSVSPWRATTAEWLLAASELNQEGVIRLDAFATTSFANQTLQIVIVCRLGPQCRMFDPFTQAGKSALLALSKRRMLAMDAVLRFASEDSSLCSESQRRAGVSVQSLYANFKTPSFAEAKHFQPPGLLACLLPFQQRSTRFLLGREGKQVTEEGRVCDLENAIMTSRGPSKLGTWWSRVREGLFYNHLTGHFATESQHTRIGGANCALLAEEMGLGKTVEVLALILQNPAAPERQVLDPYYDEENDVSVLPVKATLIVVPDILQEQWAAELLRLAPHLKLYLFMGHRQATKDVPRESSWHEFARGFDVIIASFGALQKEVDVARRERPRSRRIPRKYERPRSPLVQLEFHRVVADEIQMVGNTTKAAAVVSMIPRMSSLAVSGTPFTKIEDLISLFRFLRVGIIDLSLSSKTIPKYLTPHLFRALDDVAVRHLKVGVRSEMTLPPQSRRLVPIDFTAVESAYYDSLWSAALESLNLDINGTPLRPDWQLDMAKMRYHLLLLRQACTHPQVAGRVLGSGAMAQGNLRSLADVLGFMREQVASELFRSRIHFFHRSIDRVVYQLQLRDGSQQLDLAIPTLQELISALKVLRKEQEEEVVGARRKGPGYELTEREAQEDVLLAEEGMDSQQRNLHAQLEARQTHSIALGLRQRAYTETLARASHWLGNVHFRCNEQTRQAGKDVQASSDLAEQESYSFAEGCRHELLKESRTRVEHACSMTSKIQFKITSTELREDGHQFTQRGIRSMEVVAKIVERLDLLNKHAAVCIKWRQRVLDVIYAPVNREVSENDPEDDQYAEALQTQHVLEALLGMYRPLLAHRHRILVYDVAAGSTDLPNDMVTIESTINSHRLSRRRAKLQGDSTEEEGDDCGLEVLTDHQRTQLFEYRQLAQEMHDVTLSSLQTGQISLRELGDLLRAVTESTNSRNETDIAKGAHQSLRMIIRRQLSLQDNLRRELDGFVRLFNFRAEYFKQLQMLSDALVDLEVPGGLVASKMTEAASDADSTAVKIRQQESRLRYLEHLDKLEAEGLDEEARMCIICTDEIHIGVLMARCGHVVCQK